MNVDALLSWPGSNRNTQPRISSRNPQPLAGSPAGSRQQNRSERRRGAAHAAAQRAERGKAFRGHGRQSLDALGTEPLAGMARVPRTMRRYKDSTSVFSRHRDLWRGTRASQSEPRSAPWRPNMCR